MHPTVITAHCIRSNGRGKTYRVPAGRHLPSAEFAPGFVWYLLSVFIKVDISWRATEVLPPLVPQATGITSNHILAPLTRSESCLLGHEEHSPLWIFDRIPKT